MDTVDCGGMNEEERSRNCSWNSGWREVIVIIVDNVVSYRIDWFIVLLMSVVNFLILTLKLTSQTHTSL